MCKIFYKIDGIDGYLVKVGMKYFEKHKIYKVLELTGIAKNEEEFYDFEKEFINEKVIEDIKEISLKLVNRLNVPKSVNLFLIVDFFNHVHVKTIEVINSTDINTLGSFHICDPTKLNYAELMFEVVKQTDQENWDYFSEENTQIATEFLDYGQYSRVIYKTVQGKDIAIAYIQLRLLKQQSPQLLYKDLYHLAGLNGKDLWEKSTNSSRDLPVYVDVIAIKKEYQNQREVLKLVPEALSEILDDIDVSIQDVANGKIFAVGVTNGGRKMCNMLKMNKCSEVERVESGIPHTRTLYYSERNEFKKILKSIMKK
jgi:hypothetical protein